MKDKVIVITGASGGIGAAVAELLAARGASLVLAARREDALRAVADRCGARALVVVADVTRRSDVRRIVDEAIARYGRIDVWINNAGRGITCPPSQLTDDDIDEMVRVNVKSALYGMQEVLPHFQARGSGHIINISSELGRVPYVMPRAAYSGAKHYLNVLTENLRDELQATHPGIEVSTVLPGVVRTEFGVRARRGGLDSRLLPNSQSAEEVAEVVAGVIESPRRNVYTQPGGHRRVVDYYTKLGAE